MHCTSMHSANINAHRARSRQDSTCPLLHKELDVMRGDAVKHAASPADLFILFGINPLLPLKSTLRRTVWVSNSGGLRCSGESQAR